MPISSFCKCLVFALAFLLFIKPAYSQSEVKTLLESSGKNVHFYKYFQADVGLQQQSSHLQPFSAMMLGLRLGLTIDHTWQIAIGGLGKLTRTRYDHEGQRMGIGYGYVGLYGGYTWRYQQLLHVYVNVFNGLGTANEFEIEADGDHSTTVQSPLFWACVPEAGIEINTLRTLQVRIGMAYQWAWSRQFQTLHPADLHGLQLRLSFRFERY